MSSTRGGYKRKNVAETVEVPSHVIAQFVPADDPTQFTGPSLNLPTNATPEQLELLLNELLAAARREKRARTSGEDEAEDDEGPLPYAFSVEDTQLTGTIEENILRPGLKSGEETLLIRYVPQAVFRVRPVTRCSSSLNGHTEAILAASFSPDGDSLASASGDTTVRIWDLQTETPRVTCKGHKNWVLCVAWSPDGERLASGSMDNTVRLWDPMTGKNLGDGLKGHSKWISAIAWEPIHLNAGCSRLASASKDGTVRIWDANLRRTVFVLAGHTGAVTCLRWGGNGWIYSGSQDKTIRVWDGATGKLIKVLQGHAHWVNTMALSTDFVLRTGAYDHTGKRPKDKEEAVAWARKRWEAACAGQGERLISGSDDFTMHLWKPAEGKRSIARMNGHQKLVNQAAFSPDGRLLASAGFDNSVKLWDGLTGKFIASLRGHVGAVYQVSWSSDGRMVLSSSKDSTVKAWDVRTHKLKVDLPGHADEVYCVDWSPGGDKAVSAGKDKTLRIWKQ